MGILFLGRWLSRSEKPASNPIAEPHTAEPEDAGIQFDRGRHLAQGEGVVQDLAQAAEWYRKAAGQGHSGAQFNLGLMYGQGRGVLRNEAAAVSYLRQAAESGHPGAQYHVGVKLYRASKAERRSAASESRIEAFKWLLLAVAQTYRGADSAREFVALGMTRDEVNEGGRRAAAFAALQTHGA